FAVRRPREARLPPFPVVLRTRSAPTRTSAPRPCRQVPPAHPLRKEAAEFLAALRPERRSPTQRPGHWLLHAGSETGAPPPSRQRLAASRPLPGQNSHLQNEPNEGPSLGSFP